MNILIIYEKTTINNWLLIKYLRLIRLYTDLQIYTSSTKEQHWRFSFSTKESQTKLWMFFHGAAQEAK